MLQDGAASDSLDPAMRMMHVSSLMRQGAKLVRGGNLGIGESHFQFQVISAVPFFKVSAAAAARQEQSEALGSIHCAAGLGY
jgi:hypothetical protein